jgi:hypothetical protein
MDPSFLPNQSNTTNDPVSFLKGGGKYEGIKNKLCEKRKTLEFQVTTTDGDVRDEIALDLMRLKESMRTFGVTEIDYQAYLSQQEKQKASTLEHTDTVT